MSKKKAEQTVSKPEKVNSKPSVFSVYIGPTIRNLVQNGDIFNCSVAAVRRKLSIAIIKYPTIANLIVPGEELAEAQAKVKTPGTAYNAWYNKLQRQIGQ